MRVFRACVVFLLLLLAWLAPAAAAAEPLPAVLAEPLDTLGNLRSNLGSLLPPWLHRHFHTIEDPLEAHATDSHHRNNVGDAPLDAPFRVFDQPASAATQADIVAWLHDHRDALDWSELVAIPKGDHVHAAGWQVAVLDEEEVAARIAQARHTTTELFAERTQSPAMSSTSTTRPMRTLGANNAQASAAEEATGPLYAFNISAVYRGTWTAERSSDEPSLWARLGFADAIPSPNPAKLKRPREFESDTGIILFMLRAFPTWVPPPSASGRSNAAESLSLPLTARFAYVEGEVVIRDGTYSSARDLRYPLAGFYCGQDGRVILFSNMENGEDDSSPTASGWLAPAHLEPFFARSNLTFLPEDVSRTEFVNELSAVLNRTKRDVGAWQHEKDRARFRTLQGLDSENGAAELDALLRKHYAVRVEETAGYSSPAAPIGPFDARVEEDLMIAADAALERARKNYAACPLTLAFQVDPLGARRTAKADARENGATGTAAALVAQGALVNTGAALSQAVRSRPSSDRRVNFADAVLVDASTPQERARLNLQGFTFSNASCSAPAKLNGKGKAVLPASCARSCSGFRLHVDASVLRLESFFAKGLNYAYMMSFVSLVLIALLHRQMAASDTAAAAARVSPHTLLMQALLDSYAALFHGVTALHFSALFNAFVVAAFLEVVLFALFELRFLLLLLKVSHPEAFSRGIVDARRAFQGLYARFYASMALGLVVLWLWPQALPFMVVGLYSCWVPQIALQAVLGCRRGLRAQYVYGTSLLRMLPLLYFWGCPQNFLSFAPHPWLATAVTAWMAVQLLVLHLQQRWGARFFVPRRFLPPVYDYHRPLPLLAAAAAEKHGQRPSREKTKKARKLRKPRTDIAEGAAALPVARAVEAQDADSQQQQKQQESAENAALAAMQLAVADVEPVSLGIEGAGRPSRSPSAAGTGADADIGGSITIRVDSSPRPSSPEADDSSASSSSSEDEDDNPCPICHSSLLLDDAVDSQAARNALMVCPCDHVFHTPCLRRWMKQKQECPMCRAPLPVEQVDAELDDEE